MKITQRQSAIGSLILLIVSSFIGVITSIVQPIVKDDRSILIAGIFTAVCSIGLLLAYMRGVEQARYVAVIAVTLITGIVTPEPYLTQTATITFFIPAVFALVLATPAWMIGSSLALWLILLARANWHGIYLDPTTLTIYILTIGGMVVARLATDTTRHEAEESTRHIEEQRTRLEQQADSLAAMNQNLQSQIEQQSQLLDLVTQLETPAVRVAEGVLLAPVVGHIDGRRAHALTNYLLDQVGEQRTKLVILDIAGVTTIDTQVARALMNTAQALRLLGCKVCISGISSSVAMSLIHLGVSLEDVQTARSPQEALVDHMGLAPLAGKHQGRRC